MTIDERLEALTHSVELIAAMQKDNEKRIKRLIRIMRSHELRLQTVEDELDEGNADGAGQ
jgi:hypothetical protein